MTLDNHDIKYCSLKIADRQNNDNGAFPTFQISVSLGFRDARDKFDGIRVMIVQKEPRQFNILIEEEIHLLSPADSELSQVVDKKMAATLSYGTILSEQRARKATQLLAPLSLFLEVYDVNSLRSRDRIRLSLRTLPQDPVREPFRILVDSSRSFTDFNCPCLILRAQIVNVSLSNLAAMHEPIYSFRIFELRPGRPKMPELPPLALEKTMIYAIDELLYDITSKSNWVSALLEYCSVQRSWLCTRDLFWKLFGRGFNPPWTLWSMPFPNPKPFPPIGPELVPFLNTIHMRNHLGHFGGFKPIEFARTYVDAAQNLRFINISTDIFYNMMDILKERRTVQLLEFKLFPAQMNAKLLTWADLMSCIEGWTNLTSLSVNLNLLEQKDRGTTHLIPSDYNPRFSLKRVLLSSGQLTGHQFLLLFVGPKPQLVCLTLYRVIGLTNRDLWYLFNHTHPTLENLDIQECCVTPPTRSSANLVDIYHALDAFIERMTRLVYAAVDGETMTLRTIIRKQRSDSEPSRLIIRAPCEGMHAPDGSLASHLQSNSESFLDAMEHCGWDSVELKQWLGSDWDWHQACDIARKSGIHLSLVDESPIL